MVPLLPEGSVKVCGRLLSANELALIRQIIESNFQTSRENFGGI